MPGMAIKFLTKNLSPSEQDPMLIGNQHWVLFEGWGLKGIAEARGVSVGTIKAQINSIFRKSKTGNRAAFLGLFIDEFLDESISNEGNLSSR